jgi:hypothetical protein
MNNWKTTVAGVLVLIGAITKVALSYIQTGQMEQSDLTAVLLAISALGHIASADAKKEQK